MIATATMQSPLCRVFLGWDLPALPEVARRLAERYRQGDTLDLGRIIVVVPGQRAGRRLQERLAYLAEDDNLRLTPPQVVTQGRLPEMLYTPKLPFANDVVQDLAWAQALRELPAEKRRHLIPRPPETADALRWMELAKVLRRLHVELAADGLDFAAVRGKAPKLAGFRETERWDALVAVQVRYLQLLDQEKLWDIQTARLKAIEFREIRTDCDIVLVGTVDLNNTIQQMLERVADRVTAYIVAPEELADRFDAHGCLVPAAWCDVPIPLRDEQLRQVDGPAEQVEAVTQWLADLNGRFAVDEIVIGAPDALLVPQLQRHLEQSGIRARWIEGMRLKESAPYRLLAAAVRFGEQRRFEDLAALMRHSDVESWLCPTLQSRQNAKGDSVAISLPAQLDRFYNTMLPSRIDAGRSIQQDREWPDLAPVLTQINTWLVDAAASRPLRQWGDVFRKILYAVYGNHTLNLDTPAEEVLHRAFLRILQACDGLASLPPELDTATFGAVDAFQITLGPIADDALPPPDNAETAEILGWLELPLDDSRAVVVTSFNEGLVPQAAGADAFLPDRLRKELGLLHNERRYSRDAYATSVLCQSREELRVVFARRDVQNDPMKPSRLLFAGSEETLIRRARQYFAERQPDAAPRRLLLAKDGVIRDRSLFKVPEPVKRKEKLERLPVTRFKSYLACPFRYYLRHVRKLEAVDDSARELDGSAFGTLLHGTLSAWGRDRDAPRDSTKPDQVFQFLDEYLHLLARQRFGAAERASIRVQLEQARRRLKVFSVEQVKLMADGWRVVYAESAEKGEDDLCVSFRVNGEAVALIGRIDRIDFHEASRTLRILDYKTADLAETPDKTHRNGDDWIDLQLPLYRHLALDPRLKLPKASRTELGYFNLPKQIDKAGVALAEWDEASLQSADEAARRVICGIRDGVFWPPTPTPPDYCEDLAAICLDNVLGPSLTSNDEQ